jgi:excisionase family DNA binding protein
MMGGGLHIPTMLTVKEAARAFNLSEYFLRRLIQDPAITKQVRVVRSGVKVLINGETLADWLTHSESEADGRDIF